MRPPASLPILRITAISCYRSQMTIAAERNEDEQTRAERRNLSRLHKGVQTSKSAYYVPILKVLEEMGGSGSVAEVLERVHQLMKPVLKDVDYQPLTSNPDIPRWRNTAQWARKNMVIEGLLKNDSPYGVWEITDAGRRWLKGSGQHEQVKAEGMEH